MSHRKQGVMWLSGIAPVLAVGVLLAGGNSASAATGVTGTAFGYGTFSISIFGGPQNPVGPTPTASLSSDASNSPQSASAATGSVIYGPATLFTSDAISVQTSGTVGSKVSSTASVKDANKATTQSSTGSEILTADSISSTCSATASGTTGSSTFTNGTLTTDNGPTPPTTVPIAANPAPNTSVSGVVHPSTTSTDHFHVVFNEQSTSNGVLTVNAADEYFDGPTLKGNLIVGQVQCGLTASAGSGTSGVAGAPSPSTPGTGIGMTWMAGVPLLIVGAGMATGAALEQRRARRRATPKDG